METIILAVRLGLRRAWRGFNGFLDRKNLVAMPPVPTIAVLLVVGLLVPMALGVDRTPADVKRPLAVQRLRGFTSSMPDTSPSGETYCPTPAFHWKKHPEAVRYRLELFDDGVLVHLKDGLEKTHYVLPAPGGLQTGHTYRFAVEAISAAGTQVGQIAATTFTIKGPDAELARVSGDAAQLDPADAAFVMAGLYAARSSVHDVRSALTRYLSLAPKGKDAELASATIARR